MEFIETADEPDFEFKEMIKIFEKQEILQNQEELRLLFQLISKIGDNHHRTSDFFTKLEQIFQYLISEKPSPISYFIPEPNKFNNRILFLLIEKGFLQPDETYINEYLQSKPDTSKFPKEISLAFRTYYYLYPVLKKFIDKNIQQQIEKEINDTFEEEISTFTEKCQIGENDSYICSLIREDSVKEFIIYVNRTNILLSSQIKPSIFETNSYLIDKEPTLIEYASFFGSIQIIRFLKIQRNSINMFNVALFNSFK